VWPANVNGAAICRYSDDKVPVLCGLTQKALHFTEHLPTQQGVKRIPRQPFIARPPTPTGPRTNDQIRAAQVRVLDVDGQQIGVMPIEDAIRRAEEAGLDLIEVAATADPPVCRIADLGKFKFEQDKRARESKKNQHVSEVKEVRLRPRTDDHDLQVRVRAARRFLEEGHKVKVEVRFRGREATHPEVARDQINRIAQGVSDIAIVERAPSLEGRSMFAILARGRAKVAEEAPQAQNRPAAAAAAAPAAAPAQGGATAGASSST
jgi:translation initiation factor IF-3